MSKHKCVDNFVQTLTERPFIQPPKGQIFFFKVTKLIKIALWTWRKSCLVSKPNRVLRDVQSPSTSVHFFLSEAKGCPAHLKSIILCLNIMYNFFIHIVVHKFNTFDLVITLIGSRHKILDCDLPGVSKTIVLVPILSGTTFLELLPPRSLGNSSVIMSSSSPIGSS